MCVCVTTKDTLYDLLIFQHIVLNLAITYAYVYFLPVGPSGKKGWARTSGETQATLAGYLTHDCIDDTLG